MIKSLMILISVVCKYFKLSLLTSYFFCIFSTDLYFLESVITSCYSCAPQGKISKAIVYVCVLRSSWFSSVVEEFDSPRLFDLWSMIWSQSTASHLFARTRSFHRPTFILPVCNFLSFPGWKYGSEFTVVQIAITTATIISSFKNLYFRSSHHLHVSFLLRDELNKLATCTSPIMHRIPPPPKKKNLHNPCFSFLLGITAVPREIEDNAYWIVGDV